MKQKGIIIFFFLFIIIIVIIIGSIITEEPVELSVSHTSCLGGKICFVGETIELNVKLNSKSEFNEQNTTTITVNSDIKGLWPKKEDIVFNQNKVMEISLPLDLAEGEYSFSVSSPFLETNNLLLKIKHIILKEIFSKGYSKKEEINVRYPKIDFKIISPEETSLKKVYDINLMNKDIVTLECKTRIELSPDILLEHQSFKESEKTESKIVYESSYENISPTQNSKCCNSIQINANTMKAIAQIKIIPICKFDEREVIIRNVIKQEEWRHDKRNL